MTLQLTDLMMQKLLNYSCVGVYFFKKEIDPLKLLDSKHVGICTINNV